jgi:hypothetical protein
MKKITLIFSSFFLFLLICSCSKTEVVPKTKTDLLIANIWKVNKVIEVINSKPVIRFERGVTPTTLRDDLNKVRIAFLKDGTYSGTNADNQKETGIWIFANNETQIETKRASSTSKSTLYIDKLEDGKLNFTEKDGSDAAQYELIPE